MQKRTLSASAKRKNFESRPAATECFKIVEPLIKEKRWEIYQGPEAELLEEEHKRTEYEREVE